MELDFKDIPWAYSTYSARTQSWKDVEFDQNYSRVFMLGPNHVEQAVDLLGQTTLPSEAEAAGVRSIRN